MKAKPSIPETVDISLRVALTCTVGWPLLSRTKLCGCGLPPNESRAHLVSCAVIETDAICEYVSRNFVASTWQNSSLHRPVFSRATTLTTFLMVSVDTVLELSWWV